MIKPNDAETIQEYKLSAIQGIRDIDPDAADFRVDDAFDTLSDVLGDLKHIEKILEDYSE
jgi:hypothetical protein